MVIVCGKIYYTPRDISELFGVTSETVRFRIRRFKVEPDFDVKLPHIKETSIPSMRNVNRYFSMDKVNMMMNYIPNPKATIRKRTKFQLIQSNFDKKEQYEYFNSKMNDE